MPALPDLATSSSSPLATLGHLWMSEGAARGSGTAQELTPKQAGWIVQPCQLSVCKPRLGPRSGF